MFVIMIRRCLVLFPGWIHRNKPPGFVMFAVSFFVVCYIVIVRLDSSNRVKVIQHSSRPTPTFAHVGTKLVRTKFNVIPPKVMEEFARENAKEAMKSVNYDYYNDIVNTTEDYHELSTGIYVQNDNERIMQEELEENEEFIDDNWHNYLARNNSVAQQVKMEDKRDRLPINSRDNHRQFQGMIGPARDNTKILLRSLPKYVNIFDAFSEGRKQRNSINKNKCILLKTLHGNSPICIHDPKQDEIISAELSKSGAWEPNYLYAVGSILRMNPDMLFLDLGCNIGVYTILAAKLGHKVFALDPNKINLRLLAKSVSLGGLTSKVTLLCNAISDVRKNVTLTDIVGNVGATFVESVEDGETGDLDSDKIVFSITLDDLLPVFKHQEVFIKMDIETYELRALRGAENFFKQVEVKYVLMEWLYHKQYDSGKEIIEIMTKYGLYPHVNAHHNTKLEPENYKSWPGNVMWIKY